MKSLILSLLILFPSLLFSQEKLQVSEARTIYMQKIIEAPQYSKAQLYDIALSWVSEVFNSPKDVVSFNDPVIGIIKGTFYQRFKISLAKDTYSVIFDIQIKKGRLKIRLDNIHELLYDYALSVNILKKNNTFRKYGGLTNDVQTKLSNIIESLEHYIKDYKSKQSDW